MTSIPLTLAVLEAAGAAIRAATILLSQNSPLLPEPPLEASRFVFRLPSGKEMGVKVIYGKPWLVPVDAGNGQVFEEIPVTSGKRSGTFQYKAIGGFGDGKLLDNSGRKNEKLCLYSFMKTMPNNPSQHWEKNGNKLISLADGRLQIKENAESIGFLENGDEISFIPV
jgi:hypothetical protein